MNWHLILLWFGISISLLSVLHMIIKMITIPYLLSAKSAKTLDFLTQYLVLILGIALIIIGLRG